MGHDDFLIHEQDLKIPDTLVALAQARLNGSVLSPVQSLFLSRSRTLLLQL